MADNDSTSPNYNDVLNRIKNVYSSCSEEDQKVLRQILYEVSKYGRSDTYEQLWLADYKEIPVDKYTFLTDSYYLGETNNNGKSIYPAWMKTMLELEKAGNQYYEIVLTGATRTGKTSTAVSDAAYQLYRLMCLKDPQKYFGLKSVSTISVFFFNLTATLARGVAFREFNDTLAASPWFMEHGHMSRSEANPTYIPDGSLIEVEYGSDSSQALGKATYCLVGNTEIITDHGIISLEAASNIDDLKVAQLSDDDTIIFVDAEIKNTSEVTDTIRIELDDGSTIEGTPDHKVLLSDGSYKCLKDIKISDDLKALT